MKAEETLEIYAGELIIPFDENISIYYPALLNSMQEHAIEFIKWLHENGYRTAGWDDTQLNKIYEIFNSTP